MTTDKRRLATYNDRQGNLCASDLGLLVCVIANTQSYWYLINGHLFRCVIGDHSCC